MSWGLSGYDEAPDYVWALFGLSSLALGLSRQASPASGVPAFEPAAFQPACRHSIPSFFQPYDTRLSYGLFPQHPLPDEEHG